MWTNQREEDPYLCVKAEIDLVDEASWRLSLVLLDNVQRAKLGAGSGARGVPGDRRL